VFLLSECRAPFEPRSSSDGGIKFPESFTLTDDNQWRAAVTHATRIANAIDTSNFVKAGGL